MAQIAQCDRCGKQAKVTTANVRIPVTWREIRGVDLCEKCSTALDDFLRPLPQIVDMGDVQAAVPRERKG